MFDTIFQSHKTLMADSNLARTSLNGRVYSESISLQEHKARSQVESSQMLRGEISHLVEML